MISAGSLREEAVDASNAVVYRERVPVLGLGAGLSWNFNPKCVMDVGFHLPTIAVKKRKTGLRTSAPSVLMMLNYSL